MKWIVKMLLEYEVSACRRWGWMHVDVTYFKGHWSNFLLSIIVKFFSRVSSSSSLFLLFSSSSENRKSLPYLLSIIVKFFSKKWDFFFFETEKKWDSLFNNFVDLIMFSSLKLIWMQYTVFIRMLCDISTHTYWESTQYLDSCLWKINRWWKFLFIYLFQLI